MKILSENSILLCCRQGSCPTIELINDQVVIKDDYFGTVKMDLEQAELIGQALNLLKKNITPNKQLKLNL